MKQITIQKKCTEDIYEKRVGHVYGKTEHKVYHSEATGLDRGVNILTPADYNKDKKYPVLYLLHGILGDEYTFINDTNVHVPEIAGNLLADGKASDMIIVYPNMYASSDPKQQPAFSLESMEPYNYFINDLVQDLIPYIEKNYSVRTDREGRAIAGFSLGGREALFIGFRRPDLFGYIGAISPAPGLTPGIDWAMTHPGQMKEEDAKFTDLTHLPYVMMICCGTKDHIVGKFPESYHKIFTANKVEHIWYEIPDADHDANAIQSGLNNFLTAIFHED